ncbi:hypothetical protein BU16DRAFT_18032 [Lophium mytilinum]|uniref:Uncharacterized protein n=1 Tax=Lophium mytilinum TaxID=390894 RepID=A0A6A6RE71_9PEZI|nr:hypothetical protein BU16DRAFT_18032 [Lophium mytilinum]
MVLATNDGSLLRGSSTHGPVVLSTIRCSSPADSVPIKPVVDAVSLASSGARTSPLRYLEGAQMALARLRHSANTLEADLIPMRGLAANHHSGTKLEVSHPVSLEISPGLLATWMRRSHPSFLHRQLHFVPPVNICSFLFLSRHSLSPSVHSEPSKDRFCVTSETVIAQLPAAGNRNIILALNNPPSRRASSPLLYTNPAYCFRSIVDAAAVNLLPNLEFQLLGGAVH